MASSVQVTVNRSTLVRITRLPGGLVDRDLRRRAERVAARARQTAPGSMKESIHVRLEGTGRGRVAHVVLDHPAARYVTEGTRPHLILPRRAPALRFTKGGKVIFAKRVNHPGNKANPFLGNALREVL